MNEPTHNSVKDTWPSLPVGAVLILLMTFLAYLPALHAGFLWDDNTLITENPIIRSSDGLRRIWFTTEPADYYPLTNSLGWLQWRIWGENPLGYHVLSILLHAVNAILVWLVLRRLQIPGAWWAGLVFALHPVNVATAAWISEQKNTLSMLFYLIAILLYLRFDNESRWNWYGLSLVNFILALLSKSAVVMLPVVLLMCVWWIHGRWRPRDILLTGPFFLLSAVFGLVAIKFQDHHRLAVGLPISSVSVASHLAVAGSVPWFYLSKALLPTDLTLIYPQWQITDTHGSSFALGAIMIGLLVLFWWKRNTWGRPLLFAFGYFVVMLFPVLGFFDQTFYRYASVADHWQYYSIIAPIALVVVFAWKMGGRLEVTGQQLGRIVAVGVLVLLGFGTWTRASIYASNETLWRDNVIKNPEAFVAHHNLGQALAQSGKLAEAVQQFEETLRLKPDFTKAQYNLGNAMAQLGQFPEAIEHFQQALQSMPDEPGVHNNLGNALAISGRLPEAVQQFQETLRLQPDSTEAHYGLGLAFEQLGRPKEAIEQFELVLKSRPKMVDAQDALARLRGSPPPSN